MKTIALPFKIEKGKIAEEKSLKEAINRHIDILLSTPCYSCAADPGYGYIFNNLRFEIFNENEGVVYNSSLQPDNFLDKEGLYEKKISGSSKNLNTFAAELKDTITKYEKRLDDIQVSMTYVREEKKIYVNVRGFIKDIDEQYSDTTTMRVWK